MPLNCRAITLTTGVILKEEKKALSCGGEANWEAFLETILVRVIASQKLSRDSTARGESIFAARHQDASQGPLGMSSTEQENRWYR